MDSDIDWTRKCADVLQVDRTPDVEHALTRLLTDDSLVWRLLDLLAAYRTPATLGFSEFDAQIEERMRERWGDRVDHSLLRKRNRLDTQARRLLTILASSDGKPMSLRDLLLHNEFSLATVRRLRSLKNEHGAFEIDQSGQGRASSYQLVSPDVNIDACAEYWLKNNIRDSKLAVHDRLLALLKARMPEKVTIDEFRYVNPGASEGKGRARAGQAATDRRVRDLREHGWQVYSNQDKVVAGLKSGEYVMLSLDRIPPYERLKPAQWRRAMDTTGGRCSNCGWGAKDGASQGRKVVEVHHRDPQHARPEDVNDISKLVPLCNVCHDAE